VEVMLGIRNMVQASGEMSWPDIYIYICFTVGIL